MIIDSPIISGSYLSTGSLSQTGNVSITGSLTATAGVSGSFSGSGANLFDIPAAGIVGLNLSQISSGSVSASISPNQGLLINTSVSASNFTGSFTGSLTGTATSASYAFTASSAVSASYSQTASYLLGYISPFPYTGSAAITGSLIVTGSLTVSTLVTSSGVRYVIADANGLISAQTASAAIFVTQKDIATAAQTSFNIVNGYSTGYVTVFVNGTKLSADEYTDTSGTAIVLATGSMVNDTVEFQKYMPAAGVSNNSLRTVNYFTTTLGQTNFTVNYTPGLLDVFYNGSKLNSTEYTAANGTSITLATGSNLNDSLEVDVYSYQVGAFSGIGGVGVAKELAFYNTTNSITGSNKVTYDGSTFSITGSFLVTGSSTFTNIGPAVFSGSVTAVGGFSGSFSGNADSASLAQNSLLLQGTGSVGFTTTASFLAVSSSQQEISASLLQVSASYIALSASYNTFSGSVSTRITDNSASIQQVSSSQQQISASLLNVISIFATTGSNSFRATQSITGSLTVTGQIIAQTLNVQQVTSSIIYSSGSNNFGCDLNSRQTFTGSVLITGSLTIAGASSAASYSGTTIYGSTAVCSPVGKFTTCIDAGSGTFSGALSVAGSGYFPAKLITLGGAEFLRYNANIGTNIVNGSQIALSFGTRSNNVDYDNTLNLLNGNVGIGTLSPVETLDVMGAIRVRCNTPGFTLACNSLVIDYVNTCVFGSSPMTRYYSIGCTGVSAGHTFLVGEPSAGYNAFIINGSGHVTKPCSAAFHAAINASTCIGSGGTMVKFNCVIYNAGGGYNGTTSTFTAPVSGMYQFNFTFLNQNVQNVDGGHAYLLTSSGVGTYYFTRYGCFSGTDRTGYGNYVPMHGAIAVYLPGGATACVAAFWDGPGAFTHNSAAWSNFTGYLVG